MNELKSGVVKMFAEKNKEKVRKFVERMETEEVFKG